MRSFSQLWPTLKRLLAYGSPWRKPLGIAVLMMWVAAAAEVSGCIDSLEVRKKPGGHWIIRDLMGLDLVGLASL